MATKRSETKAERMRARVGREAMRVALAALLAEIRRVDGEGNLLPDHLPAMRAAMAAMRS